LAWSVERDALALVLSSQWLFGASDAAAVKAGRRPPPKAARSGLDGGEAGATILDWDVPMRTLSGVT
jgi:hypothetical protein